MNVLSPYRDRIGPAAERLNMLIGDASTALRDPAHHPITMLLLLAAAAAALLLVLTVVFLFWALIQDYLHPPARKQQQPVKEVAPEEARRGFLGAGLVWTTVAAVVLFGAILGWRTAVSDTTCARCHYTRAAFASRASDSHAKVACSQCHVVPGVRGTFLAMGAGAKNLRVQLDGSAGGSQPASNGASSTAQVQNSACLSCHKNIATGVVVAGGIRMRHSDVLDIGYACTDCHSTAGHGPDVVRARYPTMTQCIQCHDGTKAPSRCPTCHSQDVGIASRRGAGQVEVDLPKVTIKTDGCRGCHTMSTCIQCHGIELPHSQQFIQGYHARKALLEPQTCVKCHGVRDFCNARCHAGGFGVDAAGLPTSGHGTTSQFIASHSRGIGAIDTESSSCSCHTKGGSRQQFCNYCHGTQPSR